MYDIDKDNTAYNSVLANYWLQQAFNTSLSVLEQQTQLIQAELTQAELFPAELTQVKLAPAQLTRAVWNQANLTRTVGTIEGVAWPQRCGVRGFQVTTLGTLPSLQDRIRNAVSKVALLIREIGNQDQFTDIQKWAVPGDLLECLTKVQAEGAIAIARYAGFEATANRLVELRLYEEELECDEQPLNPLSMKQFLRFLFNHRELKEPGITVTDEGNIKAIWQESKNQIFWIEFSPNEDVRYLAFVPNEKRSDGIERAAGLTTISDIFDRAKEFHATAWMEYDTTSEHT